ncbi:alanine racemase [Campylobacter mucosalis]|uniref:alanine racemase n=1 Tax=Campylobacter mucosalis TaxID=202 RepID=UPI00146FF13F|nr:alanine racemase [Campylobacter mucosalis]
MARIYLDKNAYINNLECIAKKVGDKERVILVLKDNAYGHGATLLAGVAKDIGFKFCAVKNEYEADELEPFFDKILILSHIPEGNESQRYIYATNCLKALRDIKDGTRVHLAVDTLMHRNGIQMSELDEAFEIIKAKNLVLEGAFTHHRGADELSAEYFVQDQNFKSIKSKILKIASELGFNKLDFHSRASAAFERAFDFDDELVRVGIAQLGYAQFDATLGLKPVLSLWAKKVSSRVLKAGQGVGYGGKFVADSDMNIATYDLGYGDGLLRYNGVGRLCLANNEPLLGRMSMDSFSSKDTGEWVCVFDDARVWAKFFNTIEYEILVKLSPFIKREWR